MKNKEEAYIFLTAALLLSIFQFYDLYLTISAINYDDVYRNFIMMRTMVLSIFIIFIGAFGAYDIYRTAGSYSMVARLFTAAKAGLILGIISSMIAILLALAEPYVFGTNYAYPYSILGGAFPSDTISYVILSMILKGSHIFPAGIVGYHPIFLFAPIRIAFFMAIAISSGLLYSLFLGRKPAPYSNS
jgi:hypothetical protein